eukprot:TRINITY_DN23822_c0_g2_i1.p1 TRINITY_DN23822_c0_g2~~TRINITY_DN23822_c0_g2_i1.p1  ORF type:complete len:559 (-),score=82.78 TRINITY_DN23822_c0_g2_i1:19-1695(-)
MSTENGSASPLPRRVGRTAVDDHAHLEAAVKDSIAQLRAVSFGTNFAQPWQKGGRGGAQGTGFAVEVEGKPYILTNAHVVHNAMVIEVQRYGTAEHFPGVAHAVGPEVDLALVEVASETFWRGTKPLPLDLDLLPHPLDHVYAAGFPLGGDNLSFTRGIVSRFQMVDYTDGTPNVAIQIDAAINHGNSGCPILSLDGKVVGIAFSGRPGAQSMGYMIPMPVVKVFLENLKLHGSWPGVCSLGVAWNQLENPYLRQSLGLGTHARFGIGGSRKIPGKDLTGVLVVGVDKGSPAEGLVQPRDVILAIDGLAVANDGSTVFRGNERVPFWAIVRNKPCGASCELKILRDGEERNVTLTAQSLKKLIPATEHQSPRSYLIVGGLVFLPLSDPLMRSYVQGVDPKWLVLRKEPLAEPGQQIVVLNDLLDHPVNRGYEDQRGAQLTSVDGIKITNMASLYVALKASRSAAETSPDPNAIVRFDFSDGTFLVFDRTLLWQVNDSIVAETIGAKPWVSQDLVEAATKEESASPPVAEEEQDNQPAAPSVSTPPSRTMLQRVLAYIQ